MKYLTLILLVICLSCKKDHRLDCFKSTGKQTTENRDLPLFNSIEIYDNINLIVIQDTVCYAEIEAGENIISGITTRESNNNLILRNENKCNWIRSYRKAVNVTLHLTKLIEMEILGSGYVKFENQIKGDSLKINIRRVAPEVSLNFKGKYLECALHVSTATVSITGECDKQYLYLTGNGLINSSDMRTAHTFINNSSSGDCQVWAEEILEASIHTIGNVYYKGNPKKIVTSITDKGKLIKL